MKGFLSALSSLTPSRSRNKSPAPSGNPPSPDPHDPSAPTLTTPPSPPPPPPSPPPPHPTPQSIPSLPPAIQLQTHTFLLTHLHTSLSLFLSTHSHLLSLTTLTPLLNSLISSTTPYYNFSSGGPQLQPLPTTFSSLPLPYLLKCLATNIIPIKSVSSSNGTDIITLAPDHPANLSNPHGGWEEEMVMLGFENPTLFARRHPGEFLSPIAAAVSDAVLLVKSVMGYDGSPPTIGAAEADETVLNMYRAGLRLMQVLGERYYDAKEWGRFEGILKEEVKKGRERRRRRVRKDEDEALVEVVGGVWKEVEKEKRRLDWRRGEWRQGEVRVIMGDAVARRGGEGGVWAGMPGVVEDRSRRGKRESIGNAMEQW